MKRWWSCLRTVIRMSPCFGEGTLWVSLAGLGASLVGRMVIVAMGFFGGEWGFLDGFLGSPLASRSAHQQNHWIDEC